MTTKATWHQETCRLRLAGKLPLRSRQARSYQLALTRGLQALARQDQAWWEKPAVVAADPQ